MMTIQKQSGCLKSVRCVCYPSLVDDTDLETTMEISRLFGPGVDHLFIVILIWNFRYLE